MIKKLFLIIGALLLACLWYISPILKPFPAMTGSYQVGTQTAYFMDLERAETFSESSTDKRILVGHIFYPVDNVANAQKASYLGNKMPIVQSHFSERNGFPAWLTKLCFRNVTMQAYIDVPLSHIKSNYPVVLFSHGLLGLPSDFHVVLLEELASHGYIVIGIDHPYFNLITVYPDGGVVSSSPLTKQFEKMSPSEQKEFQNRATDIYKADIRFVLDQLALLNNDQQSIFYNRFNLSHIGVMGHSAGGTAAIELCRDDNRCRAAIDLDGWYDQAIGHEPIAQPLLLLFGSKSIEATQPTPAYLQRKQLTREQYFEREQKIIEHKKALCASPNCSMVVLSGIDHGDFGDNILLKWPLRSWNDIDSYKTVSLINEHSVDRLTGVRG